MDTPHLKRILERHIVPMFTGATLSECIEEQHHPRRLVLQKNPNEILVRASEKSSEYLLLRRSQPFDITDVNFVRIFVGILLFTLGEFQSTLIDIDDVIDPIIRLTIAALLPNYKRSTRFYRSGKTEELVSDFISKLLAKYQRWAEQTYEGRKIAAAVGVNTGNVSSTVAGVKLLDIFDESFGMVVANGLESFLTADANGEVVGYEPMGKVPGYTTLLAPLKFCHLAKWASGEKIGFGLNRNGEILVFANNKLVFAKRRGIWRHFTHEAIIKMMSANTSFHPQVCAAVYRTCLDVSFAKTGGGIALIASLDRKRFRQAKIVDENDKVGSIALKRQFPKNACQLKFVVAGYSMSVKGRFLQTIADKPFYELDRHLRQDLVAMDGATILDHRGKIIAAGAIVKVDAGSDGGGRLSAAKTLAKYGQAIKISSDGEIRGFKQNKDKTGVEEVFTVG